MHEPRRVVSSVRPAHAPRRRPLGQVRGLAVGLLVTGLTSAGLVGPPPAAGATASLERISVASDGTQGNRHSGNAAASADGRSVAFDSSGSTLVPGDTNGTSDVFVRDRRAGTTRRVSVAGDGTQGDGHSGGPSISGNGRYVAFQSTADNLVPGDTNGRADVFVHDRDTGATTRVSVATDGTQGNDHSVEASISATGRYVAYQSAASNLVPGDTNTAEDVFVHDRRTGTTRRVSVATDRTQGNDRSGKPSISGNGRYVAYESWASTLVRGDTNGHADVFVRDSDAGTTRRVSVASDGTQSNGGSRESSMTARGRYVAYVSDGSTLVPGDTNAASDVFVHDRRTGATRRVSVASDGRQDDDPSWGAAVSANGRFVTFHSTSSMLVPGDTNGDYDVFLHDRRTGSTRRVSVAPDGTQGNAPSFSDWVSPDGRLVVFTSYASTLVPGDTNFFADVVAWAAGAEDAAVRDAIARVDRLRRTIARLPDVPRSTKRALLRRVGDIRDALEAGRTRPACRLLARLIAQVDAHESARRLSSDQATRLRTDTRRIRAILDC